MAESNLKEMMIDDINNDESNETNQNNESQTVKIRWYLIDSNKAFCKTWNFLITILTIYNMFVCPFIMVFPEFYSVEAQYKALEKDMPSNPVRTKGQKNLRTIEFIIDSIYLVEIILNFFKRDVGKPTLLQIGKSYLKFYFIFDFLSIIPLFAGEDFDLYPFKFFRFVHLERLYIPLDLFL